jgi:hypothetical protein
MDFFKELHHTNYYQMINNTILSIIAVLFFSISIVAQHQDTHEKPLVYRGSKHHVPDSATILHAFKNGKVHGHFRYFFMATDNASGLTDYFANAGGGGIHYQTAQFKGFQFGVSGFYVFNLYSSDLSLPDPSTNQMNRYEIGLFDIEDAHNKRDIDRLEELFLKYNFKKNHITVGRQMINTPFINLQDGRMRPTGVEGVWIDSEQFKNTRIQGGYLYAVSPRSTTKFYDVGESIGLYPSGVNADGSKAHYHGNLSSAGIFSLGATREMTSWLKLSAWDLFVENIFNSALLEAEVTKRVKEHGKWYTAGQFIRQDAVNDGGNIDPSKTYFEKGGKSMSFGFKTGLKNKHWDVSLNYNRITSHGRYLVPREWGRDPFFTFMPRERNEGFGNVHAFVARGSRNFEKIHLKTGLSAGYVRMPDVLDFRLNKYGVPSYAQVNLDVRYGFDNLFKGMEAQMLVVYKHGIGETYGNDRYVINKVNMLLWNFVINYHF